MGVGRWSAYCTYSKLYCILISLYIVSPNYVVSKAWVSPERDYLVVNWKLFLHFL